MGTRYTQGEILNASTGDELSAGFYMIAGSSSGSADTRVNYLKAAGTLVYADSSISYVSGTFVDPAYIWYFDGTAFTNCGTQTKLVIPSTSDNTQCSLSDSGSDISTYYYASATNGWRFSNTSTIYLNNTSTSSADGYIVVGYNRAALNGNWRSWWDVYAVEAAEDGSTDVTVSVSSNYGTYSGSAADMIDGSASTYWWTNAAQSVGQYVRFSFSSPVTFHGIETVTSTVPGDCVSSGSILQYTTDGTNWITAAAFDGASDCTITGLSLENVTAVRIYAQSSSNKWLSINEVTLDYSLPETVSGYIRMDGSWTAVKKAYRKADGSWEEAELSEIISENMNLIVRHPE